MWPRHDDALATDEMITMGVQVCGTTYGTIEIAKDADNATSLSYFGSILANSK
jgi:hypothetical protein